ncbi:MAG: hypothetical protein WDO17_15855 [Alphaproteobacteria bacterium]
MAKSKRVGGGRGAAARRPGSAIPPGWKGGFAQSNPKFAYNPQFPNQPDLSSLPLLDNMANICKLTRQQKVWWPEFSWQTVVGDESSRAFSRFAHDISRIGYTDTGRVYSIICPQQGIFHRHWGTLNIEVTVTGNRGWVDETAPKDRNVAADLTTMGQIWFSPAALQTSMVRLMWMLFANSGLPFPDSKANSIKVKLWNSQNSSLSILKGRSGESTRFKSPDFARHWNSTSEIANNAAWSVANLEVMIGTIIPTGNSIVDGFNQLVMDAFNVASGNLLTPYNTLTWNVWVEEPTLVDPVEWADHAEKWRKSIDEGGQPGGGSTPPRYFDGTPFLAVEPVIEEAIDAIIKWLKNNLGSL